MTVSAEAVIWGYRFFLGRDPESPDVVEVHRDSKDALHLAQKLVASAEFRAKQSSLIVPGTSVAPQFCEQLIETKATEEQIAGCLAKIKAAWSHLGTVAPHFSVLTSDRYRPANIAQSIETFWRSGDAEAEQFLRTLARYGLAAPASGTCVEFGCGVGRVTMGLARHFAHVDAYDISAAHLELARGRAREVVADNITFHECSANLLGALAPCDAFYSRLVFQHNPPPVIVRLICNALRALRPGGIAVFQIPAHITGYSFELRKWLQTEHALDMHMHCIPQRDVFESIASMGCELLEVREDNSAGAPDRIVSNVFVVRRVRRGTRNTAPAGQRQAPARKAVRRRARAGHRPQ
jgi:SAM-dependent methyltransferase